MKLFKIKVIENTRGFWEAKLLFRRAHTYRNFTTGGWELNVLNSRRKLVFNKKYTRKSSAVKAAKRELLR